MPNRCAVVASPRFLRNQETSPLLRLPGELRNIIYGHFLDMRGQNGVITACIICIKDPFVFGTGDTGFIMPLLLASRQLYNEFHPLVYRRCTFIIENTCKDENGAIDRFKRKVDSRLQASVRILHVSDGSYSNWEYARYWSLGSRLKDPGMWLRNKRWHPSSIFGVSGILPNLEKLIYTLSVWEPVHYTRDFWKRHLDKVEKMNKSWVRPMMEVLFVSRVWNVLARRHANGEFEDLSNTPIHLREYLR